MTINAQFFASISDQAGKCKTCEELQRLVNRVAPQISAIEAAIASQTAVLSAAQELLTLNPTDLPGALSFIGKLKTEVITPLLVPYAKYIAQAAETVSAVAGVSSAIGSASSRIGGCSITGMP